MGVGEDIFRRQLWEAGLPGVGLQREAGLWRVQADCCFAGHPSADSHLLMALGGGRLGCLGPLGSASVQGWQALLP